MPALYITQPGATLRNNAQTLVVTCREDGQGDAAPQRRLLEVEPHRVETIVLLGEVHVTWQAMRHCLEAGAAVAWLSAGGRFLGRVVPPLSRTTDLRRAQYALWNDEAGRLALARRIVAAKITNGGKLLEAIRSNYPGQDELAHGIAQLKQHAERLPHAKTRDALLGLEGLAARSYFAAYGSAFRSAIKFTSRQRHPAPDPANALLSLGYVLLGNRLAGLVEAHGFDPALGFFHEPRSGRASLALDLLEEFRHAVVDRFVLRNCNLRVFEPGMFEPDPDRPGGVRLQSPGLKTFFARWEKFLLEPLPHGAGSAPFLEVARRQIERLGAFVRKEEPYQPFLYKGPS